MLVDADDIVQGNRCFVLHDQNTLNLIDPLQSSGRCNIAPAILFPVRLEPRHRHIWMFIDPIHQHLLFEVQSRFHILIQLYAPLCQPGSFCDCGAMAAQSRKRGKLGGAV